MQIIIKRDNENKPYYRGVPRTTSRGVEVQKKETYTKDRRLAKVFPSIEVMEKEFGLSVSRMEELGFVLEEVYLE
ncbi:hypothetical protein ACFL0K_01090 [Patescibacteria group bacterium]